jgi:flagellar export protein FliJ
VAEFHFRLQRVLEYRELVEGWAKDAYLDAKAARIEAEAAVEAIGARRKELVEGPAETMQDRLAVQACLEKLAEDERQQRVVIEMLVGDEERLKQAWTEARKELQVLEKLREAARAEWQLEESRRERKEMDEFALQKRAA